MQAILYCAAFLSSEFSGFFLIIYNNSKYHSYCNEVELIMKATNDKLDWNSYTNPLMIIYMLKDFNYTCTFKRPYK